MTPLQLCLLFWVAGLGMRVQPLSVPAAGSLGHVDGLKPSRKPGQRSRRAQLQGAALLHLWEVGPRVSQYKYMLWTPAKKGKARTESPLRVGNRKAFLTSTGQIPRKALDLTPWQLPSSLNNCSPQFFSGLLPILAPKPTGWGSHVQPHRSFPKRPSLSAYWQTAPSIAGQHQEPFHPNPTGPFKATLPSLLSLRVCDPNHNFPPFLWINSISFTGSSVLTKECWCVSGLASGLCSFVIAGSRGLRVYALPLPGWLTGVNTPSHLEISDFPRHPKSTTGLSNSSTQTKVIVIIIWSTLE